MEPETNLQSRRIGRDRPTRFGISPNLGHVTISLAMIALLASLMRYDWRWISSLFETFSGEVSSAPLVLHSALVVLFCLLASTAVGWLADRFGRRPVLIAGWGLGALAVLLDFVSGLTITAHCVTPLTAVVDITSILFKIIVETTLVITLLDVAGRRNRALAVGLMLAVQAMIADVLKSFLGSFLFDSFDDIAVAFNLGVVVVGLALSILAVRDTAAYVDLSARSNGEPADRPGLGTILARLIVRDRVLAAAFWAMLLLGIGRGLGGGILRLFIFSDEFDFGDDNAVLILIGFFSALSWTGAGILGDKVRRKNLVLVGAMLLLCGLAVGYVADSMGLFALGSMVMQSGAALVIVSLLAAGADSAGARWRGTVVGAFMGLYFTGFLSVIPTALYARGDERPVLLTLITAGLIAAAVILLLVIVRDRSGADPERTIVSDVEPLTSNHAGSPPAPME